MQHTHASVAWPRTIRLLQPIVNLLQHLMNTHTKLIDQNIISRVVQLLEHKIIIMHELCLGDEFDPLNQDVDVSSLE